MGYPAYKTTKLARIEWSGDIPDHWDEWKVSHCFGRVGSGTTPKSDNGHYYDGETLWVTTAELRETYIYDTNQKVTDQALSDYSTLKLYPPDSILIAMYGATIGRLGILAVDATVNQACCVFSFPEKLLPKFFYYWLWMRRPILISLSSGGGQPNLNQEELKRLQCQVPSPLEQKQITDFLDWKTEQIDALIAKKQQLIEKLQEQRIAVITQAVTKGLNPDAPLRDSGILWLGDIPQHWRVMKYGHCTRVQEGQVDPEDEPYSDMLLIAPNHIESDTGRVLGLSTARDQGAISGKYLVRIGDIVYSKIRPHLNKVALAEFDGLCSADMYPIRTELELNSEFLFFWMLAQPFLDYAILSSMRVAMPKLNRETLSSAPLVVPPVDEQDAIVGHLRAFLKKVDALSGKASEVIKRLTEYRTALVTAATTGKIDVRDVKLPTTV